MRLLYVAPDFHPRRSGYGNACIAFVEAFLASGAGEIDVVTPVPGGKEEMRAPGLRVHRVVGRTRLTRAAAFSDVSFALWRKIASVAREHEPDLVLFETAEFPRTAARAMRRFGWRAAIRVHACAETEWVRHRPEWNYRQKRGPTRRAFQTARTILSTTHHYLDDVREHFLDRDPLVAASKMYGVVPNTLPTPRTLGPPSRELRELVANHRVLLTLGRMDAQGELQKNFRRLLQAFSMVVADARFGDARLVLVGKGDRKQGLMALSTSLGLDRNVLFLDELPAADLAYLQGASHGVVLASTFEGLSMFALESLAAGAPLVMSRAGGLRDVVVEGKNGHGFDALDPADIAEALRKHLGHDARAIAGMRKASKRKYEQEFAPEVVMRAFLGQVQAVQALAQSWDAGA